jgi:hypothetical protein
MTTKLVCDNRRCDWHGTSDQVLRAPNPFEDGEILGCPKCKDIRTLFAGCDEPGCTSIWTCGTPSPTGYRQTCGRHVPIVAT